MSRHNEMPPVPPANRSHKGTGDNAEVSKDTSKTKDEVNIVEQGETARRPATLMGVILLAGYHPSAIISK
jgi:hypothetical protein